MKISTIVLIYIYFLLVISNVLAQEKGFCWKDQGGGFSEDFGNSIDLGPGRDPIITGGFNEKATFGNVTLSSKGLGDIYVARYDVDTGDLIWLKQAGGVGNDAGLDVSADRNDILITGFFENKATFDTKSIISSGAEDIFIARYSSSGTIFWAVKAGGPGTDTGQGVAIEGGGGIYVVGTFTEKATFGAGETNETTLISDGAIDAFIAFYSATGKLIWARRMGGTDNDRALDVTTDFDGNAYVIGEFNLTANFGQGGNRVEKLTSRGSRDVFLAKFDPFGNLIWVRQGGGAGSERGSGVAFMDNINTEEEHIYITGRFQRTAFFDSKQVSSQGRRDIFLVRYDVDGNVIWARSAGGPGDDEGHSVRAIQREDDSGPQDITIQITGEFENSAIFGNGQLNKKVLKSNGARDIFVAKYHESGRLLWAVGVGGSGPDLGRGIDIYEQIFNDGQTLLNSLVVGHFQNSVTLGTKTFNSRGGRDVLIFRLEDLAIPKNLSLTQIALTPYLTLNWKRPDNFSAPIITNVGFESTGQACDFKNRVPGEIYQLFIDYIDSTGDVNSKVQVNIPEISTAQGSRAQKLGSPIFLGGQISGSVRQDMCIRFGNETSLVLKISIKDQAGNVSNVFSEEIFNPLFGQIPPALTKLPVRENGFLYNAPRGINSQQAIGDCGRSVNLIGYNIYRTNVLTGEEVLVATVPVENTTFRDETTTKSTTYIYKVTAVYQESESEHVGEIGPSGSPSDDELFTRVFDVSPAVDGEGGRSAGSSWADVDNDEDVDLFVVNYPNTIPNSLYLNNGDGTFNKMTSSALVTDLGSSYGASWGDYNNDGLVDVFVANTTFFNLGEPNFLYQNNGGGSFTKVTSGDVVSDSHESNSGSWGDYDNDGDLDLFVANGSILPQKNALYENSGPPNYVLNKVSDNAIVDDPVEAISNQGAWADFDQDGDLDLFVANGGFVTSAAQNNVLYRNLGGGNFEKVADASAYPMIADGGASTGASWGDYDDDGDLDLFVANDKSQADPDGKNFLYQNNGPPNFTFTKIATGPVVTDKGFSKGSSWGDYDNDGDLDLFVSNDDVNFLYQNDGNGIFTRVPKGSLVHNVGSSNGCTWADFDGDGYLDMFVVNSLTLENKNFLYLNNRARGTNNNKWINIKLQGTVSNRAAIGAKVTIKTTIGTSTLVQTQEISGQTGGGWSGQNSMNIEFGLKNASTIDSLIVEWPSGVIQKLANVTPNQFLTITEVVPNNNPTVANPIPDQIIQLGGTPFSRNLTASPPVFTDPDGDPLTFSANSSNTAVATASISGSNLTVNAVGGGIATITITADDGKGGSESTNFNVTVNRAPVVANALADINMNIGDSPFTRDLTATPAVFSDPDGDALNFNASSNNASVATASISGFVLTVNAVSVGNATVTVIANDGKGGSVSDDFIVNVSAGTFTISGQVVYDNTSRSPIKDATVSLNGESTNSDATGQFTLSGITPGSYTLTASKSGDWGGGNATDGLKIIRHFVGLETIPEGLRRLAADVTNNGTINSTDALQIVQRFVGTRTAFAKPDWLFTETTLDISANQSNLEITGIAAGDVNGSYIPPTSSALAKISTNRANNLQINSQPIIKTHPHRTFHLPIRVGSDLQLGALSLTIHFPEDLLKFKGLTNSVFKKNLIFNEKNGILYLAWFDDSGGKNPVYLQKQSVIFTLKFLAIQEFESLTLDLEPGSEFADARASPVVTELIVPAVKMVVLPSDFALYQNYPNPFNPTTRIQYDLKSRARVTLTIFNILGNEVARLVEETQEAGNYEIDFNASNLTSGVYFYQLTIKTEAGTIIKRNKMVLLK